MPQRLTDGEIEALVARYREAMPRYEDAAALIESRLKRALRAEAIKAVLSARAKHPDDVRNKLERLRDRNDPRATFDDLSTALNRALTDLAGARVIVYHPGDEAVVFDLVQRTFTVANLPGALEVKRDIYRASHVLVELDASFERASLRGTVVEVQIVAIANHAFNEVEHGIRYKDHGHPPTAEVLACVEDVEHGSRLLDRSIGRLLDLRHTTQQEAQRVLEEPEELRHALEALLGRPMSGDFTRLLRLIAAVAAPITVTALRDLGEPTDLIERGRTQTQSTDDVVAYALGLLPDFPHEFKRTARSWRGPTTELKRAILERTGRP